jgi:DNA-binding CsgD family transcriptional regulator
VLKATSNEQNPNGLVESCTWLLEFFSSCSSIQEICTRLVLDKQFKNAIIGAYLFKLESNNEYLLEVGHGSHLGVGQAELMNGDGRGLEILELQSQPKYLEIDDFKVILIPLLRRGVPERIFVIQLARGIEHSIVSIEALKILQMAGSFIRDSMPLVSLIGHDAAKSLPPNFRLNDRHKAILSLMRLGLTNRQIASRLNLSESMIRQENIKIFRYLRVFSRKEAAQMPLDL